MATLLVVYQAYYILAGIAGLALYPTVARICYERFQRFIASGWDGDCSRDLLIAGLTILVCSAEVQFCFSRAATLIRMAA